MKTIEEVTKAIVDAGLEHRLNDILALVKPSVRLRYSTTDDGSAVGTSRFGGLPDLPDSIVWPTWTRYRNSQADPTDKYAPPGPLYFLLQVNLVDIAEFDLDPMLPKSGMLYFFAAGWVNAITYTGYENEGDLWRLIYYDGDLLDLKQQAVPKLPIELSNSENYQMFAPTGHQFRTVGVEFDLELTLPGLTLENPFIEKLQLSEDEWDRYDSLVEGVCPLFSDAPIHRLFGHPQLGQGYFCYDDGVLVAQLDSSNYTEASNVAWEFGGRGAYFLAPPDYEKWKLSAVELYWESY